MGFQNYQWDNQMIYNNKMNNKNQEEKQVQDRIIMEQVNQKIVKKENTIKQQVKSKDKGQVVQR